MTKFDQDPRVCRLAFPFLHHRTMAEVAETARLERLYWDGRASERQKRQLDEMLRWRDLAIGS